MLTDKLKIFEVVLFLAFVLEPLQESTNISGFKIIL